MRGVLLIALTVVVACGGEDRAGGVEGDGRTNLPTNPTTDPCNPVNPGCTCDTPRATSECKVYRRSGSYIACSTGTMTCGDDKKWGLCEGAATVWVDDAGRD